MREIHNYVCTFLLWALLTSCSVAAQNSSANNHSSDKFFGFTPWQELDLETPASSISMYELVVNGEARNNQYVKIQGFLHYEEKNGTVWSQRLYVDRESLEYKIYKNSVEIGELLPDCQGELGSFDGEFILLSGVYRNSRTMMSPIDHIRVYEFDDTKREVMESEILCNDSSIIFHENR